MTDFSNWAIDQERGEGVSFLLSHRGVDIVLNRNGTLIAAQTVMIVPEDSRAVERSADQGQSAKQRYVVIGTSALNIRRGDRFSYRPANANQLNFEVTSVNKTLAGQVQAQAVEVT